MKVRYIIGKLAREAKLLRMAIRYGDNLKDKLVYYRYARLAPKNGVVFFRIDRIASDYVKAMREIKDMPQKEKEWFCGHGFNPNRKAWYGVNAGNYKQYISDFEFYRKKAYSGIDFAEWYDNKLNTYYLLAPFKNNTPKHYFFIKCGEVFPLLGHGGKSCSCFDVVKTVKEKPLAAKRCCGGHGDGFYKFQAVAEGVSVNGKVMTYEEFCLFLNKLNNYIITDFVTPSVEIRALVGDGCFAVMRVLTVFDNVNGPKFERCMIRLGTTKAGDTQALHDTIYAGVDDDGRLFDPIYEKSDYLFERITVHPETQLPISGFVIPNMDNLKSLTLSISEYLPMTPYLIFDIVPSDDGFYILEINSHGQPFLFEPFNPVKRSQAICSVLQMN